MEFRTIGRTQVSLAGLGCNNFGRRIDEAASHRVIHAALEAGVTLFDTADIYGDGHSEEFLGTGLGSRRDEAVIVTKFGMGEPPEGLSPASPETVARACENSLRRLGTDRIDVYILHEPDPATPVGDTLEAMARLVEQGKVREIGCSNVDASYIEASLEAAAERGVPGFSVVQNHYSLLHREPEAEVLPACQRLGLSFMPYFPLDSGLLTGKYRRGEPSPEGTRLAAMTLDDSRLLDVERFSAFAEAKGHTLIELALSWLAAHPSVATVIAGATKPDQVRSNAAATLAWQLSPEELEGIPRLP